MYCEVLGRPAKVANGSWRHRLWLVDDGKAFGVFLSTTKTSLFVVVDWKRPLLEIAPWRFVVVVPVRAAKPASHRGDTRSSLSQWETLTKHFLIAIVHPRLFPCNLLDICMV